LFKDVPSDASRNIPNRVILVGMVTAKPPEGYGVACKIRNVFNKLNIQLAAHQGKQGEEIENLPPEWANV
jgi:hypothetical protein